MVSVKPGLDNQRKYSFIFFFFSVTNLLPFWQFLLLFQLLLLHDTSLNMIKHAQNLVAQDNYFVLLTGSVDQEFRQCVAGTGFPISGASAGKT